MKWDIAQYYREYYENKITIVQINSISQLLSTSLNKNLSFSYSQLALTVTAWLNSSAHVAQTCLSLTVHIL